MNFLTTGTTQDTPSTRDTDVWTLIAGEDQYPTSVDDDGCLTAGPMWPWSDHSPVLLCNGRTTLRGEVCRGSCTLGHVGNVKVVARQDGEELVQVLCLRTTADRMGHDVVSELPWHEVF